MPIIQRGPFLLFCPLDRGSGILKGNFIRCLHRANFIRNYTLSGRCLALLLLETHRHEQSYFRNRSMRAFFSLLFTVSSGSSVNCGHINECVGKQSTGFIEYKEQVMQDIFAYFQRPRRASMVDLSREIHPLLV